MDANFNPDKECLRLLREKGDKQAFCEIYERYWHSMFNAAYKRLKDRGLSQDIVQNIFIDIWARQKSLDIENLSAFLHTAVRFQVFKVISRSKESPVFLDLIQTISSSPFMADGKIIENELQVLFEKFLLLLPESRRKIFVMHYLEELSSREISDKLGISQKTVQNQMKTAENQLRNMLARFLSTLLTL